MLHGDFCIHDILVLIGMAVAAVPQAVLRARAWWAARRSS
jgi:hypothetical protein